MRGNHPEPDLMFSYVSAEQRVPKDHPLLAIRALVDDVLDEMSREFDRLYAATGRHRATSTSRDRSWRLATRRARSASGAQSHMFL